VVVEVVIVCILEVRPFQLDGSIEFVLNEFYVPLALLEEGGKGSNQFGILVTV
jgi:hypothetical protein